MLEAILYVSLSIVAATVALMARQLAIAFRRYTPSLLDLEPLTSQELPSVSVCIPARNEQHALTDCLQHVLSSTYEKLEIIVLDDASGDDTSALIRSFASEGVRFVEGSPLKEGWLGKNHALEGLLREASGSYILFMDVDTHIAPKAISTMVQYAVSSGASMVSVMPRREDGWRMSILASPLRFFWELLFSRKTKPATSSNFWLIKRDVIMDRFGGFDGLKNTVQPESVMATELVKSGEYRFLISTPETGVAYEKKWRSQLGTSIRLLYPLLGKQSALVIMAALDLVALFLLPVFVVASGLAGANISAPLLAMAALVSLASMALYGFYARRLWKKGWLVGAVAWPLIVIQEIVLLLVSLIQHSRRTVKWKGRLIQPEAQN